MGQLNCVPQDQSIEEETNTETQTGTEEVAEAEAGAAETQTEEIDELAKIKAELEEERQKREEIEQKFEVLKYESTSAQQVLEETLAGKNEIHEEHEILKKKMTEIESLSKSHEEEKEMKTEHIQKLESRIQDLEAKEDSQSFVLDGVLRKFRKKGKGRPVQKHVQFIHDHQSGKNFVSYAEDENSEQIKRYLVKSVSTDTKQLNAQFEQGQIKRMILLQTENKTIPLICNDSKTRDDWFYKIKKVMPGSNSMVKKSQSL